MGRKGLWKCPSCGKHQIWKVRKSSTSKLDRNCIVCGERIRATLDRSSSGKGRRSSVDIWERSIKLDDKSLFSEIQTRDRADSVKIIDNATIIDSKGQSGLVPIFANNWRPEKGLDFPSKVQSNKARSELLRFVSERNEGYLDLVAVCWDSLSPPEYFNGDSYHSFSLEFENEMVESLSQRLMEPHLLGIEEMEIIPRRRGSSHLARRITRLMVDLRICLRRIAYYHSITLEQREIWQRWMTRTRIVDEHLKELFTDGLETPDGGKFTGKGFRSTWQEGVVACASALTRAIDLPESEIDNADVIAPMIRDLVWPWPWDKLLLRYLRHRWGRQNRTWMGETPGLEGGIYTLGTGRKGSFRPPPHFLLLARLQRESLWRLNDWANQDFILLQSERAVAVVVSSGRL